MAPRVSVIIATYNRAHLLRTAIDSVLGQTYSDYEVLVVDDGSTDGTAELVHAYGDRIHYVYQENQGKSVALNNALAVARGEWIALLDSDDYWLPEKLEWQFRAIEQFKDQQCGACFTDGRFVNNPKMDTTLFQFYGRKYYQVIGILPDQVRILADSSAGVSVVTLVARADLMRRAGAFDPSLRFTEDYDLVFRLALLTNYCFVNIPLAIIDRTPVDARHTGVSAVWNRLEFRIECEQYRYEKWLALSTNLPSDVRTILLKHLRCVHSAWANWYFANEDYEMAQRALASAAKCQLSLGLLAKYLLARVSPKLTRGIVMRREAAHAEII